MPLEHLYDINRTKIPLPLGGNDGVQIGRWIADDSVVSLSLVYAAAVYAHTIGKAYAWLNHSAAVHRVLTQKGIVFHAIPDAQLRSECIPDGDRMFYDTHPDVRCHIMCLPQVVSVLDPRIRSLMCAGEIIFNGIHITSLQ